jgi:hypothetical protein
MLARRVGSPPTRIETKSSRKTDQLFKLFKYFYKLNKVFSLNFAIIYKRLLFRAIYFLDCQIHFSIFRVIKLKLRWDKILLDDCVMIQTLKSSSQLKMRLTSVTSKQKHKKTAASLSFHFIFILLE